jgi:hypothetical protein
MIETMEIPEELFEFIKYDEKSPSGLTWIKARKRIKVGDIAGYKNRFSGYWQLGFNYKVYKCHRIIYKIFNNINIQDIDIDHIDNNVGNNSIENLRVATESENMWNRKTPSTNKSGVKGVYFNKLNNKWHATISKNGKRYHLGYFDDINEAERIVKKKREELHGEFARNE